MNLIQKNTDKSDISLHILFWLLWIVSFTIIQSLGSGIDQYLVWLIYYVITLPVFVIHTYLIAYFLLPKVFYKGRYFLFSLAIIILLIVFSVIELVVSNELVFKPFAVEKSFPPGYLNIGNIIISGIGNHYIILVFLAIKAGRRWYLTKNIKDELVQSTMETELEIYRYQLQPKLILSLMEELEHVTSESAERSPEMIIKISNFLNRFLFEGREELIPLHLEIKLIEEFLEIHKLAVGERFTSNFNVKSQFKSYLVPPFILLPFLNDAIKLVYKCNDLFESTVIIKGEKKYLLFSFSFWSEKEFRLMDNENRKITQKRLNYNFPGKFKLAENIDDNFREINIELFN